MSIRKLVHGHKRIKRSHLCPILFGILRTTVNGKNKPIRILLDSGATGRFLRENLTGRLHVKETLRESWNTGNGVLLTNTTVQTHFVLPELYNDRVIEHTFNVLAMDIGYDMVIGTDLMSDLGLRLDFQNQGIEWDEASIPFKSIDDTFETGFFIKDSQAVIESTERIKNILDAKYVKLDIDEYVSKCTHLTDEQQKSLAWLLCKHEPLFDGTLGHWKSKDYDIELQEGAKPYHARAYPIPKIYEETLKHECRRLCNIGVLKKVNRSEWAKVAVSVLDDFRFMHLKT